MAIESDEEIKEKDKQLISALKEKQDSIYQTINDMEIKMKLPSFAEALFGKIFELYDVLKDDGKPLGAHLSVVVIKPFLLNKFLKGIQIVDGYMRSAIDAARAYNDEELNKILAQSSNVEKLTASIEDEIRNFNFKDGIKEIVEDTSFTFADRFGRDNIMLTCTNELKAVNYLSEEEKQKQETVGTPQGI